MSVSVRENLWKDICKSPRWKHNKPTDDTTYIYFAGSEQDWDCPCGENSTWKCMPVPEGFHDGACAPHFVWEKKHIKVETETEETYMGRLICALDGRFVCLVSGDEEDNNYGAPKIAERYRWKYWDNDRNVYQDTAIKWTTRKTSSGYTPEYLLCSSSTPVPVDFRSSRDMWMFLGGDYVDRKFWDAFWMLKHEGTTGNADWDAALTKLSKQVGIPGK